MPRPRAGGPVGRTAAIRLPAGVSVLAFALWSVVARIVAPILPYRLPRGRLTETLHRHGTARAVRKNIRARLAAWPLRFLTVAAAAVKFAV